MKSRIPQPKLTTEQLRIRPPNPNIIPLEALRWKTKLKIMPVVVLSKNPTKIYSAERSGHIFFQDDADKKLPLIIGKIWGYGTSPTSVSSPGPTLEASSGKVVKVEWINRLPAHHHPFTEPPRELRSPGMMSRYDVGHTVVHLHGAHVPWTSDGYSMRVSNDMGKSPDNKKTVLRPGESEIFTYPNTQPGGGTLWYHDHTMDLTSMNVYAGLAGTYLLRHKNEHSLVSFPKGEYEIPLIIQDRSFTEDNELLYGDTDFLNQYLEPDKTIRDAKRAAFLQGNDPQPSPEFKGQVICVNGKIWPYLEVKPRPYRFRVVNGSNSRVYVLRISSAVTNQPNTVSQNAAIPIYQIGADGGLLKTPVELTGTGSHTNPQPDGSIPSPVESSNFLILAPGERADVIIDFSSQRGNIVYLTNHATNDSPLGNGGDMAMLGTTDGILKFKVKNSPILLLDLTRLTSELDSIAKNDQPDLKLTAPTMATRQYVIKESNTIPLTANSGLRGWTAITFQPGTAVDAGNPGYLWAGNPPFTLPAPFGSVPNGGPVSDKLIPVHQLGSRVELWEFYNHSPDVHPIHLHHSYMQLIARKPLDPTQPPILVEVDNNEMGWKDTIRVNPLQKTSVLVQFDDGARYKQAGEKSYKYTGHYVWHCHILEHEDMGMMRPLEIE